MTRQTPSADLVFRHCRQLVTCAGPGPRRGPEQAALDIVTDGALVLTGDRVAYAGPDAGFDSNADVAPGATTVDARDFSIVPGFVDAHTHAVYAGDRRNELRKRLAGASYAEIAAAGGGIVSTVSATRAASEAELVTASRPRLDEMLACGTTTCEIKSGYGLDVASELKMLRAIAALDAAHPIDVVSTFMGAHEIPVDFRTERAAYVAQVCDEMLPAVAAEGLADWCDVFCEQGVFTPDEATQILERGLSVGLKARIHADELAASGGSMVAARVGARSADHLVHVDDEGIEALAVGNVIATLLPTAAFYLKLGRFAPARKLISRGVPVALATDINPGGGFSPSMPFAMTLGCFAMGLTFEEALAAATINGAWSLDLQDQVGSLEPGKLADAVFVRGDAVDLIRVGGASIAAVVKRGRVVHGRFD